jgi:hypothetical protein
MSGAFAFLEFPFTQVVNFAVAAIRFDLSALVFTGQRFSDVKSLRSEHRHECGKSIALR